MCLRHYYIIMIICVYVYMYRRFVSKKQNELHRPLAGTVEYVL